MIFLDSTILVYAVGADHPLRGPCRTLFRHIGDGSIRGATTTAEVIQEFAHVRARRRARSDAVMLSRSYARLLAPLVATDEDDLDEGLLLFEQVADLGSFDCVLAGAARRRRASALVSADRSFSTVPGLPFLDPRSPTFAVDLAAAADATP